MVEPKLEKVHCNKCLHATNHMVVAKRKHDGSDEVGDGWTVDWETTYTMLECCGCESVVMRRQFWFSEGDGVEEEYYPPAVSRQEPHWFRDLDDEYKELLEEVYSALHADSRRLAMMGARAIVDLFLTRYAGDIGGFAAKLAAVEGAGLVGRRDRETLEAALDVGHATAHRGHKPNRKVVDSVMDIVEGLLRSDRNAEVAQVLRRTTPPRT